MKTIHLLVNPAQTRRSGVNAKIRAAIESSGHDVVELRPSSAPAVSDSIKEAKAEGMEHLIIAGGDGLIHQALPAVARSGITVGIVSVGTGNDFARALGLPTKIKPAVHAALSEPTDIDLIETDGGRFAASVVTGGFSGQVNERANDLRFPPGQQRYTVATLLELRRLQPVSLRLVVDGETHETTSSLFAVANTRFFGGGMAICPTADPTDGLLDVTVIGPTSRWLMARMLPTVFSGRHVNHPAVTTYRGARIELAAETGLWADGEPFDGRIFQVIPSALQVAGSLIAA